MDERNYSLHACRVRVYKLRNHLNSPSDLLSGPHQSAQKAVEAAEKFGDGCAAFRIVRSSAGLEAKELLCRYDLPVHVIV
jgi:hypothetical protein